MNLIENLISLPFSSVFLDAESQIILANPVVPLDSLGNVASSPVVRYHISDMDEEAGYYGFLDIYGGWYIQKVTSTSIRYIAGKLNYQASWQNRSILAYTYLNDAFNVNVTPQII